METPVYFRNNEERKLYGVLHIPETTRNNYGFIFCSPTFGEKTKTYRIFVNFARFLEKHGYCVLRFDYFGEGDSDGNFENADIESRVSDIISAIKFFTNRMQPIKVCLIGTRLGASLSILAANKNTHINALILWAPIMNLRAYFFDFLRGNLSNQLLVNRKIIFNREQLIEKIHGGQKINVDGWTISKQMWEQGETANINIAITLLKQNCLIANFIDYQSKSYGLVNTENLHQNINTFTYNPEFSFNDWKNYQPFPVNLFGKTHEWIQKNLN